MTLISAEGWIGYRCSLSMMFIVSEVLDLKLVQLFLKRNTGSTNTHCFNIGIGIRKETKLLECKFKT